MNLNYIQEIRKLGTKSTEYPYSIPSISKLKQLKFDKPITFFVGENGSGKSTLLEAIAINSGLNPEGGSRNFNFNTSDTHSSLHENIKLIKSHIRPKDSYFLRAESFYNVATEIDEIKDDIHKYYGNKSLHTISHGESFMTILEKRLFGNGLYLFDEIESALSVNRQIEALAFIHSLIVRNSQFIIATHSPILLSYPGADIFEFTDQGIQAIRYEDTEAYRVTKNYLTNYKHMQKALFGS
ncbi:AAA family ATPase [Litoribacter populi]|uniref:AAA family ATPase n=1 Tax=Litoribacter populi TaxID=2598460 RepID=UPI00117FECCB|nr:AAA family ATPase [Litoribacter populi]